MLIANYSALILFTTAALGAAEPIPGASAEIEQVFEKAMKQYAGAKSYQDKLVVESILDADGTQVPKMPPKQEISLAFERPNKLAFITRDFSVMSDGEKLWEGFTLVEQYLESKAPAELVWSELKLNEVQMFSQLRHPAALALTGVIKEGPQLIGNVAEFSGLTSEEHNGGPAKLLKGSVKPAEGGDESTKVPFSAWFSEKTGLLEEIVFDHTERAKEQVKSQGATPEQLNIKKYVQRLHFGNISIKDGIPEKEFVFTPGKYDKKVDEFELPSQQEWQQKLVGRPAPDFATEYLDGKKVTLASFKGRVVLLDFWATWCGPCKMAMPHLQKVADKYQKAAVTVLGVNGDRPGTEEDVNLFLKDKKLTYGHIKQLDGAELFRVMGIPFMVLIDQKGVVQALHTGFSQELMEMVSLQIDILLKGGTLIGATAPATATAPAAESN